MNKNVLSPWHIKIARNVIEQFKKSVMMNQSDIHEILVQ
jgi:predicted nuclease of restriction endonuclease-like RecB superfamily